MTKTKHEAHGSSKQARTGHGPDQHPDQRPDQPGAKGSHSGPEPAGDSKNGPAAPPSEFAGKTVAAVFGEIVWLLSRSPKHRDLKLSDLETLVMPPLLLRQFKLFYAGKQPVAVEFYAKVSPEVAARIDAGDRRLSPADWKSGEILRVIDKVELIASASNN